MAAGITSYGAYVPYYRMERKEIAKAWQTGGGAGEKAVADYDQDSITLAVEAAVNCLADTDRSKIDRFYMATTTSSYREKQDAAIVALALDLPRQTGTADFTGSLRCGTAALRAALDAVDAGAAKNVLISAADCRVGVPKSDIELNTGDSSASLLIGNENVAVAVEGYYSHHDEIVDWWRKESDTFVHNWESRYIIESGYTRNVVEAVSATLKKYNLTPQDFSKLILYAPDLRTFNTTAAALKFDPKTQVQDPLFTVIGNSGSAFTLTMLVAALEQAKPGDRLLMVNYSSGCDVFILRVTEEIEKLRNRRGVSYHLDIKKPISSYEKYLQIRGIVPVEMARRPDDVCYSPAAWRDSEQLIAFKAQRCRKCGTMHLPRSRVCYTCKTKDEFDMVRLSDKKGTVVTYVIDNLAPSPNPPMVVAVVEIDECRTYVEITECAPEIAKIDMVVEPTFRRLFEAGTSAAGTFIAYYWKCRPVREV